MTSAPPSSRPDAESRRARLAVSLLFLTNGALFANLLPRYPEIKAALGLDDAAYGLTVTAFPAGAIIAGLAAAALIRRFSSARLAVVGTLLTSIGVLLAGVAPSALVFVAALFLAGAMDSITDVAQNAHGLRVQRRYGRSILNSFHAIWSVGAVLGGAMAAGAIALRIPLGIHLSVSGAIFVVVALVALRMCLPGSDQNDGVAVDPTEEGLAASSARALFRPRTGLLLAALVLIAIGGTVVEDAGNSWATLYLSTSLDSPAALAAIGFIALVGAQFIGRLIGDPLVDRFGQRAVARTGGVIVLVGMSLALVFPSVPGTIAGFAAAGFGVATLVPAAMSAADELPGLKHGTGLTIVSWLMRLGFLLSPPLVGVVSEATSLRVALLVIPLAGLVVVLTAQVLATRRPVASGDQRN